MTESLQKAIDETNRRRTLQEEFNAEHHITPKSVTRKIEEDLRIIDPLGDLDDGSTGSPTWERDERWDEENSEDITPGIRPMEPLQPSRFRRENARKRATDEGRKKATTGNRSAASPSNVIASYTYSERSVGARRSNPGNSKLADLERQMKEAAARLDFEEAARIRDIIRSMNV